MPRRPVHPDDEPLEISLSGAPEGEQVPLPLPLEPLPEQGGPLGGIQPPFATEASGAGSVADREQAWDDPYPESGELMASALTGPFDAFLALVVNVYDGGTDAVYDLPNSIDFERSDVYFGTNNEPVLTDAAPVHSQNTPATGFARPWPLQHDLQNYHCVAGDAVMILAGRDGKYWYMVDDEPWIGWVIDTTWIPAGGDAPSISENAAGGAGVKCLNVRRYALTADPDAGGYTGAGVQLTNLLTAAGATIDYDGVRVIGPTNVQHGYRVGDQVMVIKRGRYLYAAPMTSSFLGAITNAGPGAQADFATHYYWVKEQDVDLAFADYDEYTFTNALRTRAVTGMSGTSGRWVCAKNLVEPADEHKLTIGDLVIVSLYAEYDTKKPYYVFNRSTATPFDEENSTNGTGDGGVYYRIGVPTTTYTSGSTITLDPVDVDGADNGRDEVLVEISEGIPSGTSIPTTQSVPFAKAQDGKWYPIGDAVEVVTDIRYDTTTHKLQKKVRGIIATYTTESDWQDITTAVDCTGE